MSKQKAELARGWCGWCHHNDNLWQGHKLKQADEMNVAGDRSVQLLPVLGY